MLLVFGTLVLAALSLAALMYVVLGFSALSSARDEAARAWADLEPLVEAQGEALSRLLALVESLPGAAPGEVERLRRITSGGSAGSLEARHDAMLALQTAWQTWRTSAESLPELWRHPEWPELRRTLTSLEGALAAGRRDYNLAALQYHRVLGLPRYRGLVRLLRYRSRPVFDEKVGAPREARAA